MGYRSVRGTGLGTREATYTFSYGADLAASGRVEATRADDGSELIVLNWSPVSWDAPLGHQTLMVHLHPDAGPPARRRVL